MIVKRVPVKVVKVKRAADKENSTAGILERSFYQLNYLFVNLAQKPEVCILLVFALVLSISDMTTTAENNLMGQMVRKLRSIEALKAVGDMLGTYSKEFVAIVWFAGVYGAVPVRSRTMVIMAAMVTILALDYSMMQSGVIAIAVYLFFSVKDKQVRIVAICVAMAYTYITYFSKSEDDLPRQRSHHATNHHTAGPPANHHAGGHTASPSVNHHTGGKV